MRLILHILIAHLAHVMLAAIWQLVPFSIPPPNLVAVYAVYLGMTARQRLAPSTAAAVVLGYLTDLLMGSPRGLTALTAGMLCIVTRLLSSRFLVRGRIVVTLFGGGSAVAAGLVMLALRGMVGLPVGTFSSEFGRLVGTAILTGLFAVPVVRLCRAIDARFVRTAREREAIREGYLS